MLLATHKLTSYLQMETIKVDKTQEIMERLPHVKEYGHHIVRAFGDAIGLASHLKAYTAVSRKLICARFSATKASEDMSRHVAILWKVIQMDTFALQYPREAKGVGENRDYIFL